MIKRLFIIISLLLCTSTMSKNLNWQVPTMGGIYFWTDVKVNNGCRIQENILTGHFRVLDCRNIRYGWGKYEDCLDIYKALTSDKSKAKKALLVHGLTVKKDSLQPLEETLKAQGYEVEYFRFSCFVEPLERTAVSFKNVLAEYAEDVDVVTHSTGAILLRQYEKDFNCKGIRKAVLLAAPNNGVSLVNCLKKIGCAGFAGINGKRLYEGEGSLPRSLPEPSVDFITIAGRNEGKPYFPLSALNFEHDGLLSTETGKLKSAQMNYVVKSHHFTIMEKQQVKDLIIEFFGK
ncbi:MAG: hypothetical protein MK132_22850 [Lentisphaerales bacterium]|nr:hypothetical protein [Lentisphaerales bacterium]